MTTVGAARVGPLRRRGIRSEDGPRVCPAATTDRSASFSVMSLPKSDEASCQSAAPPESVAVRARLVERHALGLSVRRLGRISDEGRDWRARSFAGASTARTSAALRADELRAVVDLDPRRRDLRAVLLDRRRERGRCPSGPRLFAGRPERPARRSRTAPDPRAGPGPPASRPRAAPSSPEGEISVSARSAGLVTATTIRVPGRAPAVDRLAVGELQLDRRGRHLPVGLLGGGRRARERETREVPVRIEERMPRRRPHRARPAALLARQPRGADAAPGTRARRARPRRDGRSGSAVFRTSRSLASSSPSPDGRGHAAGELDDALVLLVEPRRRNGASKEAPRPAVRARCRRSGRRARGPAAPTSNCPDRASRSKPAREKCSGDGHVERARPPAGRPLSRSPRVLPLLVAPAHVARERRGPRPGVVLGPSDADRDRLPVLRDRGSA